MRNISMDEQDGLNGRNSARIELKKFFLYHLDPVYPCYFEGRPWYER